MAKIVPVIRLEGVIGARGGVGGRGLSLSGVERALEKAFALKPAPAVAIVINSPGGSAAQSSLIAGRIRALSEQKKKPVLAFVEDLAASGGYWLACAGDEILLNEASIIGSIGVIGATFGFPEMLAKIGVERRVYTAGRSKSQLDPFRPENPEDVARLKRLLDALHETFIAHVKARRGAKLKDDARLFEGEVFPAAEAIALGLADGYGRIDAVVRERFGKSAKLRPIPLGPSSPLRRLFGAGAHALLDAGEERALWARYGL